MKYKDYYEILELDRDASQEEIKRAYRRLARKYHPDVNKDSGAADRFQEVGEAYEVLKDPEKRSAYDQFGNEWQTGQGFTPPPGWEFREFTGTKRTAGGANHGFSDFFDALFGMGGDGASKRGSTARGNTNYTHHNIDIRAVIEISLEESFRGSRKNISLNKSAFSVGDCGVKSLQVNIPKGILEGQQIRLEGQGEGGPEPHQRGDLFLEVVFSKHHIFQVSNRDVTLHLPVTPWEAALGAVVKVPTLGGTVELKIPAGSQTGKKLRMKNRGLCSKTESGDQYVILEVHTPPAEKPEQKKMYEMMAEKMPFNPRKKIGV